MILHRVLTIILSRSKVPPLDSGNEAQDIRENSRYLLAGKTSLTGLRTRLFFFRRLENCNHWAPKNASKTNSAYLVRKELLSRLVLKAVVHSYW